jgi:hypothetical protein
MIGSLISFWFIQGRSLIFSFVLTLPIREIQGIEARPNVPLAILDGYHDKGISIKFP